MTALSPAAAAVRDASLAVYGTVPADAEVIAAAVLRAAVKVTQQRQYGACYICSAADLESIAHELEAHDA